MGSLGALKKVRKFAVGDKGGLSREEVKIG